jgi:DNA-directed RNA polymerase subunit RPC12/RpoP
MADFPHSDHQHQFHLTSKTRQLKCPHCQKVDTYSEAPNTTHHHLLTKENRYTCKHCNKAFTA